MKIKGSIFILSMVISIILFQGCRKNDKTDPPLSDIEGNTYQTLSIGTQVWMTSNLRTTRLNDGTEIPLVKETNGWNSLTTSAYCWYDNDEATYKSPYGAIYNGYTVATGKICPTGWHVPDKKEWRTLREYLGDSLKAGGKLKESGLLHWRAPNKGADNSSGFTALGAGLRYFEGTFASALTYNSIWSSTVIGNDEYWYVALYYGDASFIMDHRNKKHGFSIRCLKD